MKLSKLFPLFSLLFLAAFLSGCSTVTAPNLDGTQWRLVSVDGKSVPAHIEASLSFKEGQAGGKAGCNGYGSDYLQKGDNLTFSAAMSTMMYCEDSMDVENGFLAALTDIQRFTLVDGTLTLIDGSGSARLVFVR